VYLHDVEFVCDIVGPSDPGVNAAALHDAKVEYGLAEGQEATVRGDGDRKILAAIAELWKMKEEGLIRAVGITGYPLPTLLRIALLILHHSPYKPLDLVMSYSNLNLQNSSLAAYAPHLKERAKVAQIFNASPLNMGLLTRLAPAWHPAKAIPMLLDATASAVAVCEGWEGGLPNVALGYSMRHSMAAAMPVAVGLSSMKEVHESVKVWRQIQAENNKDSSVRVDKEQEVVKVFEEAGMKDYCWRSP